jgi:hypothetical protein
MHTGSCNCGAVRLEVSSALSPANACHCTICRKQSGHFFVSTVVPRAALTIHGSDAITWYRSSEKVRRGFCSTCGSALLWDKDGKDWIGIAMGAFAGPTDTHLEEHIFVADKGDYYDIEDGVPQYPQVPTG